MRPTRAGSHPRSHRFVHEQDACGDLAHPKGVTPRGLNDCLITAVAWRISGTFLSYIDLHRVADIVGVDMDPATHCG